MKKSDIGITVSFTAMWLFLSLQNTPGFFASFTFLVFFIILHHDTKKLAKTFQQPIIHVKNLTRFVLHPSLSRTLRLGRSTNNPIVDLVRPIMVQKRLVKVQNKISNGLVSEIRASGKTANPKNLAKQSTSYMVFSFFVLVPTAIALGLLIDSMLFILLAAPPSILLLPVIRLRLIGFERKAAIDDEIAFFATYGSIMQTVGKTVFDSILQVLGKKIFPIIENEGKMLNRNVILFGMDHATALNTLALSHPNVQFKNLLLGYVSIQKSGGDLGRYMEKKSDEFFNETKFRFFKYASSAETIAEIMLILLNILPILLVMSSFLMGEDSLKMITNLSFVLVPTITIMMIVMINNIQPKTHNMVGFSGFSLVIGAVAAVIVFLFMPEAWLVLAAAVFAASAWNFIVLSKQFAEITMTENALPDFFRDITEYRKIGIAIPNAIIRIANERAYNKFFDIILSDISSRIVFGMSLTKIIDSMSIRSWQARISFFVLGKIAESGGGTPQILEQITNFSTKINQAKREMVGRVRIFALMAYGSPLMMVWSTQGMKDLLEKIGPEYTRLMSGFEGGLGVSSDFLQTVNMLMVISSLGMGLIMSKLTYFTMKHTLTVATTSAIAIISVYVMPFFPSMV
ncbi:MAG: type II secretion system F family protein [Nitrososphaerota archaeon]